MAQVPRVEMPSLLAQTEHVARIGAARATRVEHAERAEADYVLELASRRAEEVQAAAQVSETSKDAREHDERPQGRQHPPADDDDDELQDRHVDVMA